MCLEVSNCQEKFTVDDFSSLNDISKSTGDALELIKH